MTAGDSHHTIQATASWLYRMISLLLNPKAFFHLSLDWPPSLLDCHALTLSSYGVFSAIQHSLAGAFSRFWYLELTEDLSHGLLHHCTSPCAPPQAPPHSVLMCCILSRSHDLKTTKQKRTEPNPQNEKQTNKILFKAKVVYLTFP